MLANTMATTRPELMTMRRSRDSVMLDGGMAFLRIGVNIWPPGAGRTILESVQDGFGSGGAVCSRPTLMTKFAAKYLHS